MKNCLRLCLLFLLASSVPTLMAQQESKPGPLLEVILTTYDVSRTETLVYLRVLSDGHAEAHSMRQVDFRNLTLKQAQVSATELATLSDFLSSSEVQKLAPKFSRYWGNVDFGQTWKITIAQGETTKSITLENFQPFLARTKKKPYPAELEKLGCLIWEQRTRVTGEPLERNWVAGCQKLGY
jgi:hypothetical protein